MYYLRQQFHYRKYWGDDTRQRTCDTAEPLGRGRDHARRARPADDLRHGGSAQGDRLHRAPRRSGGAPGAQRRGQEHHDRDPGRIPDALGRRRPSPRIRPGARRRALAIPPRRRAAVLARPRQVEGPRTAGAPARVLHALPRTLGRRRARRSGRPDRARGQAHPAALRWAAAPARRGHRHRRQPGTAVPRRTHGRVRPASPPRLPRPGAPARRRGHHRPAHHARPGRSREAGRTAS